MRQVPRVPCILVVAAEFSDSFMKDDLRILREFVNPFPFEFWRWRARQGKVWGIARAVYNVLLFVYLLFRLNVRVVIFWFAATNYAPLLGTIAKLLGRRVIVITGGIDAVYVPDIDWGAMKSQWHRANFGLLMRLADTVLPFSDASKATIIADYSPRRIRTVYPPVDTRFFAPNFAVMQPRVVTCCYQYDAGAIVQKGLDILVASARRLRQVEFMIVGNALDDAARAFQASAPANVTFVPRVPSRSGYRDLLQTCSVYAQLSAHEGFGVSLAEAMACGCIPVVSDRFALPEVVGETGFVAPYRNIDAVVCALQKALAVPRQSHLSVRERVVSRFDKRVRREMLLQELLRLIPELAESLQIIRIELGCGSVGEPGTIGLDLRKTVQTKIVSDVRWSGLQSGVADEVYSICVLEHMENPYELLDEVIRLLNPSGRAFLRVPNIGTYSAHLDLTHRFLADLALWKSIIGGYFAQVRVVPLGTKYRDNLLLQYINLILVKWFGFYELAQGWTFVCRQKKENPVRVYAGWWTETDLDR